MLLLASPLINEELVAVLTKVGYFMYPAIFIALILFTNLRKVSMLPRIAISFAYGYTAAGYPWTWPIALAAVVMYKVLSEDSESEIGI